MRSCASPANSAAPKVHAVGYCIGGTLVATYMAWANWRYGADKVPVAHWTLFTTLIDFYHPGDIEVFIDEAASCAGGRWPGAAISTARKWRPPSACCAPTA